MKKEYLKCLMPVVLAGLILTLIVQIVGINTVVAEKKGIDIIKLEFSILSYPLNEEEKAELQKKLDEATTEAEKASIELQIQELDDEITAWMESLVDDEKEAAVRESQKVFEEFLAQERSTEEGKAKQKEMLPWTSVGYDLINHSLEVTIDPEYFTEKEIKTYIKYIRKIIGNEIDLTISKLSYVKSSCLGTKSACDPMEGGLKISFPIFNCTLGFKAKFNGKSGFVTAGHCLGNTVGQPTHLDKVGKVQIRSYVDMGTCDCAFVEIDTDVNDDDFDGNTTELVRGIAPRVLSDPGSATVPGSIFGITGMNTETVAMSSGLHNGHILKMGHTFHADNGICIVGTLVTKFKGVTLGDSGAPLVLKDSPKNLVGFLAGYVYDSDPNSSIAEVWIPQQRFRSHFGAGFSFDFSN